MLTTLPRIPVTIRAFGLAVLAAALAALYCLAYNAAAGQRESLRDAAAWSLVNIAPWAVAIELARQMRAPVLVGVVLASAAAAVVLLQIAIWHEPGGFALVRAAPGLAFSAAAILVLRFVARRHERKVAPAFEPALARNCEWICAAGNYIELHGNGPARLARSTLAAASELLGTRFARVHRSYLVRRASIRRIDRDSVLLESGRRLPLGSAYRARLEEAGLVPSSLSD